MRTPADLPRWRPRASRRTRITVLVVIVVIIIGITALSGLARFWTDYLWFQSVGFTSVFRGVLLTKWLLAIVFISIFFAMMFGNLYIADRITRDEPVAGVADELVIRYREIVSPHARWVRIITSAIFALLAGVGTNREWNNWDLFRYHVSFGVKDPLYHNDVGFYVFQLPFIKFLLGWFFEAVIVVLIVTIVAHYLNGGIRFQGPERHVTAAVKTHISVLLGVLALIKGIDYYFQRLELVLSRTHLVDGATNTSVHADQPAKTLLIAIAVIAAALFLFNIRQKGWILPAVAVALWGLVYVLVGAAYPAIYQALRVNPSQETREAPYIQRNINATQAAYGLIPQTDVKSETSYTYTPTINASQIAGTGPEQQANQLTLANIRLLDPAVNLTNTFNKVQALRSYYSFDDLFLDRYALPDASGKSIETATIGAVRELNSQPGAVPGGFVNQHLEYTHGYGAAIAPVGQSGIETASGQPNFTLSGLPPQSSSSNLRLSDSGSQIYYGIGSDTGGYVIAGSKTPELDYQNPTNNHEVTNHYCVPPPPAPETCGGVKAGSIFRRAAFALRFGDPNFILSGQINPSSKVLYIRNVASRVRKAAPFLKFDSDPYAVVINGSVYWIIDAYTTTNYYPYSQVANTDRVPPNSGLNSTFNYVRNSVKVVVSAYDGSMYFVVVDPSDPIIQVYEKAFPDLFISVQKLNSITALNGITTHFRYPEDLFRVQTNMYGRYHLSDAADFYSQAQAWSVSPDPGSGLLSTAGNTNTGTTTGGLQFAQQQISRLQPQYELIHLPGEDNPSFQLVNAYVPVGYSSDRQNLTAVMTASSDWDSGDYGTLRVYQTPPGSNIDGPGLVSNAIRSNPAISSQLSLLNTSGGGSLVELGEVVVVPIDQTVLYVQPVYVESNTNSIPFLQDVVVVYNGSAYQSKNASIDAALCQVTNPDGSQPFKSYCTTQEASATAPNGGGSVGGGPAGGKGTGTNQTVPGSQGTVASLLSRANAEFTAAQTALKNGNLAAYQAAVEQAQSDVAQAQRLLATPTGTTTTLPKKK